MPTSRKRPGPSRAKTTNRGATNRRAQLAAKEEAAAQARKRRRIITGSVVGLLVVVLGAIAVLQVRSMSTDPPAAVAGSEVLVRENSHRLSAAPEGAVTFVEFLDFECESCAAAYPAVEKLRATYGDRVTFVVRYFPLDGHYNAKRAARAVEAAAQQGQFEAMYRKMYETQTQWGEQRVPHDDLFRRFAQDLNLDLDAWDAAYNAETTASRIQTDIDDGLALGVTGTPTFFLDGQRLEPTSYDDLVQAVEKALDKQ